MKLMIVKIEIENSKPHCSTIPKRANEMHHVKMKQLVKQKIIILLCVLKTIE